MIELMKAVEMAAADKKTLPTIYNNRKKYIPIKVKSKRSIKKYTLRYIRVQDVLHYLELNNIQQWQTNKQH